jgi:hypothetical protein
MGQAIAGLLDDSQESPETIMQLLTTILAMRVGRHCPAHKIDFMAEVIADQVMTEAREYQEHMTAPRSAAT